MPNQQHNLRRIREWCHPLTITDETTYIVALDEALRQAVDEIADLSLREVFGTYFTADRAEALRFQRCYFWRHSSDYESMMILVSRMGLSFHH